MNQKFALCKKRTNIPNKDIKKEKKQRSNLWIEDAPCMGERMIEKKRLCS